MPRFIPVPPEAVHQVTTAFAPATPLAVRVVVAFEHIELTAAVADAIIGGGKMVNVKDALEGIQPTKLLVTKILKS